MVCEDRYSRLRNTDSDRVGRGRRYARAEKASLSLESAQRARHVRGGVMGGQQRTGSHDNKLASALRFGNDSDESFLTQLGLIG